MLMPSIFGENLFDDDWMNFPFNDEFWGKKNPLYGKHAQNMMKTDIRETDGSYELDVDLPGFKKDEIKVQLKDGYLTLSAAKGLDRGKAVPDYNPYTIKKCNSCSLAKGDPNASLPKNELCSACKYLLDATRSDTLHLYRPRQRLLQD